ncbi:MAG: hypothetical protein SPK24_00145, partial [Candidatus Limisoma sp.]|nr:hypothetical protein [Candidatus Limisoma sp.]
QRATSAPSRDVLISSAKVCTFSFTTKYFHNNFQAKLQIKSQTPNLSTITHHILTFIKHKGNPFHNTYVAIIVQKVKKTL